MQVKPEDFTPIAMMLVDTQLMAASPQSGYKTMKQVIDASRKTPGSVKVGGTGAAGSDANLCAMIEAAAKIKLNYIPFKSGGEVNAAILGGHVDVALGNPNELFGYVESGKLVPLAVFSDDRIPALKNVPTMKEVGYNVVSRSARGVVAPAGIAKNEEQFLREHDEEDHRVEAMEGVRRQEHDDDEVPRRRGLREVPRPGTGGSHGAPEVDRQAVGSAEWQGDTAGGSRTAC